MWRAGRRHVPADKAVQWQELRLTNRNIKCLVGLYQPPLAGGSNVDSNSPADAGTHKAALAATAAGALQSQGQYAVLAALQVPVDHSVIAKAHKAQPIRKPTRAATYIQSSWLHPGVETRVHIQASQPLWPQATR